MRAYELCVVFFQQIKSWKMDNSIPQSHLLFIMKGVPSVLNEFPLMYCTLELYIQLD